MLAAIISLLQDNQPQPQPRLPTVKIDRGGGGYPFPAFTIVDYIQASATFPEIPNEDSVRRATRRAEHIAREILRIQRERKAQENAMAVGMLWGATLERNRASEETKASPATAIAPSSAVTTPARWGAMGGGGLAAVVLGIGLGCAIAYKLSR